MDGMVVSGLGLAASLLSVVSLMPQVVRTWRTWSAGDERRWAPSIGFRDGRSTFPDVRGHS